MEASKKFVKHCAKVDYEKLITLDRKCREFYDQCQRNNQSGVEQTSNEKSSAVKFILYRLNKPYQRRIPVFSI